MAEQGRRERKRKGKEFEPRIGKAHRGGKSIRKKMKSIDKNRLGMILTSLILPPMGLVLGAAFIILSFVDWEVPPKATKREILNDGLLYLVLGVINFAVLLYLISL